MPKGKREAVSQLLQEFFAKKCSCLFLPVTVWPIRNGGFSNKSARLFFQRDDSQQLPSIGAFKGECPPAISSMGGSTDGGLRIETSWNIETSDLGMGGTELNFNFDKLREASLGLYLRGIFARCPALFNCSRSKDIAWYVVVSFWVHLLVFDAQLVLGLPCLHLPGTHNHVRWQGASSDQPLYASLS